MKTNIFSPSIPAGAATRQIKRWVEGALALGDDDVVTVSTLNCADPGCPGLETAVAVHFATRKRSPVRFLVPASELTRERITAAFSRPPTYNQPHL